MSIKHVLIIEVYLTGHHPIYLEKVAAAHLELGRVVTVVVSEKHKSHATIIRLLRTFGAAFCVATLSEAECTKAMNSRWGDAGREICLWRAFQKLFRLVSADRQVDFVFFPYADYCLYAIGLLGSPFGSVSWGGICMRPAFHFKVCGVISPSPVAHQLKSFLFNRVLQLSSLSRLFSIDELLVGYVREHRPYLAQKFRYLPDPAELPLSFDVAELRQRYNLPLCAKVVLVYGAIDERKGIFKLLDALEFSAELGEWHALIVGRQSTTVRDALSIHRWDSLVQANRIHSIDEFVSDEVEHHVFALADVVWVAYSGHYAMSGVMVRAGMYRKPVIACEEGLIGWYALNKHIGVTVNQNSSSIEAAFVELSNSNYASVIGERSYSQFSAHTWAMFAEILTQRVFYG